MHLVILAAGYGTRMYPLTENCPKAFLKIKGKIILDYLFNNLNDVDFDKITIVTNNKFFEKFNKWKNNKKEKITIIDDGSNSPENSLGWKKDLALAINSEDDLLIISSDNIFEFKLKDFVNSFKGNILTLAANVENSETAKRHGILELEGNKVIGFEEKPTNPKSLTKSVMCYIVPKKYSLKTKNFCETESKKHLLEWFMDNDFEMNAFMPKGQIVDVGNIKIYNALNK